MKDTLEYNVLKYLYLNKNEKFIDIVSCEKNIDTLKSCISELKNNELIKTESYPSFPEFGDGFTTHRSSSKPDKCKTTLLGIKWLNEIENESKNITNNFNNNFEKSTIGQVVQSSEKIDLNNPIQQKTVHKTDKVPSKKSPAEKIAWIVGIIAGIVAIYKFIIEDILS